MFIICHTVIRKPPRQTWSVRAVSPSPQCRSAQRSKVRATSEQRPSNVHGTSEGSPREVRGKPEGSPGEVRGKSEPTSELSPRDVRSTSGPNHFQAFTLIVNLRRSLFTKSCPYLLLPYSYILFQNLSWGQKWPFSSLYALPCLNSTASKQTISMCPIF